MRNFTQILKFLGLIVAVLFMGSCQEEFEVVDNGGEEQTLAAGSSTASLIINTAANDGSFDNIVDGASCFAVNFPYTVEVNGLEITIDSIEDLRLIEEIFDSIDVDDDILEIIFPITITLADYSQIVVENAEQLRELAAQCIEGGDDDDIECIDFVYPLTFFTFDVDNQQTGTVVVNNDEELRRFLDEREDDDLISLEYPVSLIKADGTTITVNSNAELAMALEAAREACDEDDDDDYNDDDFDEERLNNYLIECPWEIRDVRRFGTDQSEQYPGWLMNFMEDGVVKVLTPNGGLIEGEWDTDQTDDGVLLTLDFNEENDFDLNWLVYEIDENRIKFYSDNDNRIILKRRCDLGDDGSGNGNIDTLRELLKECEWVIKKVKLQGEEIDRLLGFEFKFLPEGVVTLSDGVTTSEGSWEIGLNEDNVLSLLISIGNEPEVNFDWPLSDLRNDRLRFEVEEIDYELILQRVCDDNANDGDVVEIRSILMEGGWNVALYKENEVDMTEDFAGFDFYFNLMHRVQVDENDNPIIEGLWRVIRNHDGDLKMYLNFANDAVFGEITDDWYINTAELTADRIELISESDTGVEYLVFERIQ